MWVQLMVIINLKKNVNKMYNKNCFQSLKKILLMKIYLIFLIVKSKNEMMFVMCTHIK